MRLLYVLVTSLLLVSTVSTAKTDSACNCDHCDGERVIGLQENETSTTTESWQIMYKEDTDGDGNRTICARDRDNNDRNFPSVCHMLCFNRCTRYRISTVKEATLQRFTIIAYRTNYYKLKDGAC